MTEVDLVVIGAGPAGLMAAIYAADKGLQVTVIEKMAKPARKLGISGKGRGNLTNTAPLKEFLRHFNNYGRFLKPAFNHFFSQDLIDFFHQEGLQTAEERGGRVFTASGKATDAVRCLEKAAIKRGVTIITSDPAKSLLLADSSCTGVVTTLGKVIKSAKTIIATGGVSYPLTGSTGDGIRFASESGHKIIATRPALVALKPENELPASLEGLSLKNVTAQLRLNNKKIAEEFGEMLFSGGYIAGPIIITLSRQAVGLISKQNKVEIWLDLKPALAHDKLDKRILREIEKHRRKNIATMLATLIPRQLIGYCLEATHLDPIKLSASITANERKSLRNWLKQIKLTIIAPAPWSQAIMTAGGVSTADINPQTLESKIIKNLYFAGEVMDIDADTGGYNLQAAFSTGFLAGKSATESLQDINIEE